MVGAGVAVLMAGCSATNPPGQIRTWGDMDAAVRKACSEHELAVVETVRESDTARVYRLVSVRDEPGEVRVEIEGGGAPLRLTLVDASIGRLGMPELEREMEEAIRGWAPAHAR